MEVQTYLDLMKKQRESLTTEQLYAISEQGRLGAIAFQKQRIKDNLEASYRNLFSTGIHKLYEQYPEIQNILPICNAEIETTKALFEEVSNTSSELHDISAKMKTIPELIKCKILEVTVAKAYYDFFCSYDELNGRIEADRKVLFSYEYREKMRDLANDGVFLYFLETPDLPLLSEECNADYILESFSFGEYLSARTLFSSFCQIDTSGKPLKRKMEDAHAALEMMFNGYYRSAARNWFALIEHEHKRCANTLEGYWEAKREYKNGRQRSEKISALIEGLESSWDQEAWELIDKYYKRLTKHTKTDSRILNRNAIIHGDYESDSLDVSENDAIRLFLLWVNLRVITDHFAFIDEFFRNKVTMLPYFCTLTSEN